MSRSLRLSACLSLGAVLAGCAAHRAPPVAAAPTPVPVLTVAPMPAGAHPGMTIPALLPDGTYPTPNRGLTPAAVTWHLRAALNVAALACRGADDAMLVGRYNALLSRQRGVLRDAEAATATQYRAAGGATWRAGYDDAMTSLYNFFAQGFAREGFCATSARILAESESVDPAVFPAFAAARLPQLDAPFTDFYARYDAWRTPRTAQVAATPRIELGPVATLPDPNAREVVAATPPRSAALRPGG